MTISIVGLGKFLPEEERANDWWTRDIVDTWTKNRSHSSNAMGGSEEDLSNLSLEERLIVEAIDKCSVDPFKGYTKRHVVSNDQKSSDLEILAAREALEKSGLQADKIDFVLLQSTLPDMLTSPNSCVVHRALNLNNSCFVLDILSACDSFIRQLFIAKALIASGLCNYGILIQSSCMSRFLESSNPMSPFFGDGATAVVVGKGYDKNVMLGIETHTNSTLGSYFDNGIPGKKWYEEGKIVTHVVNSSNGLNLIKYAIRQGKDMFENLLPKLGIVKDDVNFFAGHQGTSWFREVSQKVIGFDQAKSFDTYSQYGGLMGANIPLSLYFAQKNNLIRKGENVALYSPGTGFTAAGAVLKWAL